MSISFDRNSSLSYLDTAIKDGEERIYKVRGLDANGKYLDYSNECGYRKTLPAFELTQQPTDLEVKAGETAEFSVAASGDGLSYLWQQLAPGGEWTDTECTEATYSFTVAAELDGYKYRCVVSAAGSSITSNAATLTVTGPVVIDGVAYEKTENGMKIVSFSSTESSVVIPETVGGLPVTEIGAGAFEGCLTLESIDLPDSVEIIGQRAFAGCTNLSSMN